MRIERFTPAFAAALIAVLVFSQYIETQAAAELLARAPGGVGYLLKDRVADVGDFVVVEKHVASIFGKLGLAPSDSDNRRVIAAIRYLES